LIGVSAAHHQLLEQLARVAVTDAEVLLCGPSGVGKELFARYVHEHSRRSDTAFVTINCGALPGELLENEMFGHVAGAFTGAQPRTQGLVAEAEGGTLFFDEVDALTPSNQVKLLRLVQEKEYRRLGEPRVRRADVRFIAATNADLVEAVRKGQFRADLFFRLRVVPITIPPLRDRTEDIEPLLAWHGQQYACAYQTPPLRFTDQALRRLQTYAWPGNVRELENCVRYLACLQLTRPVEVDDLPLLEVMTAPDAGLSRGPDGKFQEAKRELVNRFEREYVEQALRAAEGNIARAAQASGKARRAFFELMRKHGVDAAGFRTKDGAVSAR
jgi:DNA-binding NtrC family response regulator